MALRNPFRGVVCQHNHWIGWCIPCEMEVNAALDAVGPDGKVGAATWARLNHWQREAVSAKRRFADLPDVERA